MVYVGYLLTEASATNCDKWSCIPWKSQEFFQNHLQLDTKSMIYEKPIHNLNITEQWSELWNKGHKKVMKSFAD